MLHTDASIQGLGAVLEQEQEDGKLHPIAYASRTLNKCEQKYGITEMETLGVVWAARHFRAYLYGHKCTLFTDHAPVRSLLKSRHPSGKLARWAESMAELDIDIRYRPGPQNKNADALSRSPVGSENADAENQGDALVATVAAETVDSNAILSLSSEELPKLQRQDDKLKPLIQLLEQGTLPSDEQRAKKLLLERSHYTLVDKVLYFVDPKPPHRQRIVVPKDLRLKIIEEIHAGSFGGHFALKGTYGTLSQHYYWDGMYADAQAFCQGCLTCAAYRGAGRRSRPPLQPIPVGGPFERVGVDILEMPRTERENRYIVVFVDYMTKWVEAYPTPDQTTETIVRLLVDEIICRHGVPAQLLSDRGPNLLAKLMEEVCGLMGMKKVNTVAYHPQTDGLVEKMNRTLRSMIAKHTRKFGREWDVHLQQLLFAYRVKPQDSTQESPFFLLYGRDARLPTETALSQPLTPYMVDLDDYRTSLVTGLTESWKLAKQNIASAQKRQKKFYDRSSKAPKYQIGDRVMVYMPYEDSGKLRKLALPYHGPYRVLDVTTNGVSVRPVDHPDQEPIRVNLDRVTKCPDELPDISWLGNTRKRSKKNRSVPPKLANVNRSTHTYNLRKRGPLEGE